MASCSPSIKIRGLTSEEIDAKVQDYVDNELDFSNFNYLSEEEVRELLKYFIKVEVAPDSTTTDRQVTPGPPPGAPFSTNSAGTAHPPPDSSDQVTDDYSYPWKEVKSVREVTEKKIGAGSSKDQFVTQEAFKEAMNSAISKRIQLCRLTKHAVQYAQKTKAELNCKINATKNLMLAYTEKQSACWNRMIQIVNDTLQVKLQAIEQMTSTMMNASPSENEKLVKIFAGEGYTVRIYSSEGDVNKMAVGPSEKTKCAFCNRSVTDHVFMELETVEQETQQE